MVCFLCPISAFKKIKYTNKLLQYNKEEEAKNLGGKIKLTFLKDFEYKFLQQKKREKLINFLRTKNLVTSSKIY